MRFLALNLFCLLASFGLPAAALAQVADAPQEDQARGGSGRSAEIVPYIEAAQVLSFELSPGDDVVTYTQLAAGVDANIAGRNSAGSLSFRYERRIGYGDDTLDGDTISGLARGSLSLVPNALSIEAGALAARTRVEANGGTSLGGFGGDDSSTSQFYSFFAGPSLRTMQGDFEIEGHYRFGYTRVESPDFVVAAPGARPVDYFEDGTVHSAQARVGLRPFALLPVGVGVGGGWNEQNISNLDQRIRNRHLRADITVPLSPTLALVGGVGYEDVQISSRDALRDADGDPVIGSDGRFVTDGNVPRRIAYETDGLIWDAGVMWRPSRRTSLEAHVGRRYGSTTYYGTFSYAPNQRSSLNLTVYDNMTSFGGVLTDRLAGLPTSFDAFRNPFSGTIGGCVASLEGDGCIGSALGSIRSAAFRSRGVAASYAVEFSRTQFGVGIGYDRRRYIAAAGTVLSEANGVVDENIWAAAYATTRMDEQSSITANAGVNWMNSGFDNDGSVVGYSTSLAYYRRIIRGLEGTAAIGLDGITRDNLPDYTTVSALLGLRYSFF